MTKRQRARPKFYDFDEFGWLVDAPAKNDARILLDRLFGGDAGLRRGEIIALERSNVDMKRGLLTVEQSEWKGHVTETKGLDYRVVPMTTQRSPRTDISSGSECSSSARTTARPSPPTCSRSGSPRRRSVLD